MQKSQESMYVRNAKGHASNMYQEHGEKKARKSRSNKECKHHRHWSVRQQVTPTERGPPANTQTGEGRQDAPDQVVKDEDEQDETGP